MAVAWPVRLPFGLREALFLAISQPMYGGAVELGVPSAAAVEQAILEDDDECSGDASDACALNAAQLRGIKIEGAAAGSTDDSRWADAAAELEQQAAKLEADAAAQADLLRQQALALQFSSRAKRSAKVQQEQKDKFRSSSAQEAAATAFPKRRLLAAKSKAGAEADDTKFDQDAKKLKVNPYYTGGLVDGLPGQDQVAIMAARDLDWHVGASVYQVFVDRFVPPKDLESKREWIKAPRTLHNWTDPVFGGSQNEETKYYTNELAFWGGDLQGVLSKLDYVEQFGNVLYLQPIFDAYSSHKYDTTDYFKIAPEYGTLEDFTKLSDALHARGMHLVLDGVFNHMGVRSPWFMEAMADKHAESRDWYFIGPQYGDLGYKNWQGGGTLAELQLETKSLQEKLWNSSDSVVSTWLKRGADGWRLDVGTEIGREFLWDLTQAAHRHKYGSLVVGEVSAYPRWWTESLDGVLSFWMGWVISGVVNGKMGGVFAGMQIQDLIYQTSMEQLLRSWIILSNHDTPRLTTVYPDPAKRKFALVLQHVLPGSVCLYYGEELGMTGAGDPFNRAPMPWDDISDDNDMYVFVKRLARLRKNHRSLRIGDFHQLVSFSLLAFIRRTDRIDEIIIVLANPTESFVEERVSLPVEDILEYTQFRDTLSNETVRTRGATVQMKIPPHTARVLTMVHEHGPTADQYKRIFGHWNSFSSVEPSFSLGNSMAALIKDPHVLRNVSTDDGKSEANKTFMNPYDPYNNFAKDSSSTTIDSKVVKPMAETEVAAEAAGLDVYDVVAP